MGLLPGVPHRRNTMTLQIAWVYGVLVGAIALFLTDRFRLDLIALLALLAVTLTGILTPTEALAGFADPVVVMIAALFIVGDALFQTGVAELLGRLPGRLAGDSEVRLLVVLMALAAGLSSLMSSTGTVAVLLPVVMGLAWDRDISPSKLLIPLSVASLLGGMLTLVGTAPNLVVSNHLASMGREPFQFFTFTPIGGVMVGLGILFMALVGRRLLPDRPAGGSGARRDRDAPSASEMAGSWELSGRLFRVRVCEGSPLIGTRLADVRLPERFGVTVLELRGGESTRRNRSIPAGPDTRLGVGQDLVLEGSADGVSRLVARGWCSLQEGGGATEATTHETGIAEVLLTPRSRLLGRTLTDLRFRDRYGLLVVGFKRMGLLVDEDPRDAPLRFGDMLLVQGPWDRIRLLQSETRDFVVAMAPREMEPALRPLSRAPVAVGIVLAMMAILAFGLLPSVTTVLLAATLMVLTGCVSADDAYRAVNWESVVLIAGMLPMATALEVTGGMDLLVGGLEASLPGAAPLVMLAALFLMTSLLSQVISNTATAVLLAPIAFQLAVRSGVAPEPFMMTIAVAASTAFATPVASPVNTLVLGPGGYRFGDFFRIGVTLQAIVFLATLLLVPMLFPF